MGPSVLNIETDSSLWAAYCNSKNSEPLGKLFKRHHDMLYALAYRITGNASDADEVIQIVSEIVLEAEKESLADVRKAVPWLKGVIVNSANKYIQKEMRLRERHKRASDTGRFNKISSDEIDCHYDESLADKIKEVLGELPMRFALPIELHYLKGMSWKQVACEMDKSEDAVRKQAQRGLIKLKAIMEKRGVTPAELMVSGILGS